MPTNSKKRPMGLKAQQKAIHLNESKKIKLTEQEDDKAFTTVALLGTPIESDDQNQGDGLTFGDLIQLKTQAEELIDNPTGLQDEEDQLVNLLRGICHEAIRLIELAEKRLGTHPICTRLPHQLIAWATFELGILLTLNQKSERFVQPDEPKSLNAWLAIVTKVLDNLPSKDISQNPEEHSDLELLPHSVSLLKAQNPAEILTALQILFKENIFNQTQYNSFNYLLRTIDRLILLKSDFIAKDPTPIFNILIEFLQNIRSCNFDLENTTDSIHDFHQLIDQRLADCYLTHGSLLVEELENQCYPQDVEDDGNSDEEDGEEEFKLDVECPTYKLSLKTLRLAEQTFSNLLIDKDESHELKDLLQSKLEETLLTIGNLMPPGPEREDLYLRAGLNVDE